ncbi:MAG TPA: hypothetical protein ENL22_00005, partial [candidate division Zixibacteria bacterium]|nr:hypothetical protein [candidate division Zixibacteria bacterium]
MKTTPAFGILNQCKKILSSLILIFLFLNSGLLAQKRVTKEPRPDWVNKVTPGLFVGVSHRFANEADARADALADAKRQIIETLGGIIESEFVDKIVEQS